MNDPIIWECPGCGRIWCGYPDFSGLPDAVRDELRVGPHAPFVWHDFMGRATYATMRTCYSTPMSVHKAIAFAAYALGGREAAEACVDYSLRDSILEYERTHRAGR